MKKLNYKNRSTYYLDSKMMQVFHIAPFLERLVSYKTFKRAIEIGTAYGGFTNLIADYFENIFTFDIKNSNPNFYDHKNIKSISCDMHKLEEVVNNLVPIMNLDGNNIIFVDGGNKALETNLIANFLKPNDLIMCHDFSIDLDDFESRGKIIWNCFECKESDLNLKKIKRSELFEFGLNFGWGIYERNL